MAEPTDGGAAGADAVTDLESGAAGATGGGQGVEGAAGEGADGAGGVVDAEFKSKLHPALQALEPEAINELFGMFADRLSTEGKREPKPEGGEKPPEPPKRPELDRDAIRKKFDPSDENYDPIAAVTEIGQHAFGPLVSDLSRRSLQGVYSRYREEFPDFQEFEGEITKQLAPVPPAQVTDQLIGQVYLALKGAKAVSEERAARAKAAKATTHKPSPQDLTPTTELSEEQRSVARRLFRSSENPEQAYKDWAKRIDSGDTSLKVPIGGGKKA